MPTTVLQTSSRILTSDLSSWSPTCSLVLPSDPLGRRRILLQVECLSLQYSDLIAASPYRSASSIPTNAPDTIRAFQPTIEVSNSQYPFHFTEEGSHYQLKITPSSDQTRFVTTPSRTSNSSSPSHHQRS